MEPVVSDMKIVSKASMRTKLMVLGERIFDFSRNVVIFGILFWAWSLLAEDSETLPWKTNKPIVTVKRELYGKWTRPKAAALASEQYVGPNLERLEYRGVEIIDDAPEGHKWRFSNDNGRTWVDFKGVEDTSPESKGVGGGPIFFDTEVGVLVQIGMRQVFQGNSINNFCYSRYSRDNGKSWTKPRQLKYEPGDDFDPQNPFKPSFLLRNQVYRGQSIIRCSNGTLAHCAGHANTPSDPENDKRPWRMGGLCFIGKWDATLQDYQWTAGERVAISPELSSRGLMEPDLAELKDKRLLIVWRGSNTARTPGRKFFSVSTDGGRTLSEPAEWKYDDGSSFFSPSAWHLFIRHSITGKLYWIGNITATPPDGNWPRYPLIIGEVDEKLAALKRTTITAIDDRHSQSAKLQFSNFTLLENRESHELELLLTMYGEDPDPAKSQNANAYKYRLTLK
jgi:hypothetical protein